MNTKYLLLGLLLIAIVAVLFMAGGFRSTDTVVPTVNKQPASVNSTNTTTGTTSRNSETASVTASLTEDQKKVLSGLGIDVEKITPAMVACAEKSLGASRIEEIKGGSAVTFSEKVKLLGCYK